MLGGYRVTYSTTRSFSRLCALPRYLLTVLLEAFRAYALYRATYYTTSSFSRLCALPRYLLNSILTYPQHAPLYLIDILRLEGEACQHPSGPFTQNIFGPRGVRSHASLSLITFMI